MEYGTYRIGGVGGGGWDSSVMSGGVGVGVADQQAGSQLCVSRAAWASVYQRHSS